MKRLMLFSIAVLCLSALAPVTLQTQEVGIITIRLSYKVVLNPNGGARPRHFIDRNGTQVTVTDADLNAAVNQMNTWMSDYRRGYRFQIVEIVDVGGNGQTTGPSRWFDTDFFDDTKVGNQTQGSIWKDQMEAAAKTNAAYLWRNNAINIYVTNGICGGICSFPDQKDEILILGGCSARDGETQLHEIGHYFNLYHTQGRSCGCPKTGETGQCHTIPGDDEIADTLPDLPSWNRDQIANHSFNKSYASLSAAQQSEVDDVFLNIMSYHSSSCGQGAPTVRLTEGQLDRMSQSVNMDRVGVRTGRMIFAQAGAPSGGDGTLTKPYNTVAGAAGAAATDPAPDIIILRPGSFNGAVTINTPVTLRATRQGAAVIGSAAPPAAIAESVAGPTERPQERRVTDEEEQDSVAPRLGFAGSGGAARSSAPSPPPRKP